MPPLMQLPAYQMPRNALMDLSPISEAIDSNRANALAQQKMGMEQERLGMERKRLGMAEQSHASSQEDAVRKRIGGQALLALQDADEAKQAAIHQQILSSHPNAANLPAHYRDPKTGLLAIVGDAGMADDYIRFQIQKQTAARAAEPDIVRTLRAAGIDPRGAEGQGIIRQTIKGEGPMDRFIRGLLPQQGQPQQPAQGGFQRQSFDGATSDPNLIRVQAGQPVTGQPQDPMVNTPTGPMPQSQARKLGLGLALAGKGDAGKMFAESGALGKEAGNENDKAELQATSGLAGLRNIRASFDPDYLRWGTQAQMTALAVAAKAGKLKPEDEAKLYKFATFRRDAAENANAAIKANSGATVTPQELQRNNVVLPNAGTGILDGDDPVTFKAKLDRAEEVLALGIARSRMLRAQGFSGDVMKMAEIVPLDMMRQRINQRAAQIEGEVKQANPGLSKQMLDREVDMRVKKEFGI